MTAAMPTSVCGIDPAPCDTIIYGDDLIVTQVTPAVLVPVVGELPVTGSTTVPVVASAGGTLLLGVVLVLASVRRRVSSVAAAGTGQP